MRVLPHPGRRRSDGMDVRRAAHRSAWMAAAQDGDANAYETLLRDLRPTLRAFVLRRISNEAAADDVVQIVLLSLHRARHTYRRQEPFEPWLFAIARNAVVDFQRQQGRRSGREVPLPDDDALPEGLHLPPPSPGDGGDRRRLSHDLERALAQLPPRQREAVTMLHLEELSVLEASHRARVSPGALRVRAHRAVRALRSLLGERSS